MKYEADGVIIIQELLPLLSNAQLQHKKNSKGYARERERERERETGDTEKTSIS